MGDVVCVFFANLFLVPLAFPLWCAVALGIIGAPFAYFSVASPARHQTIWTLSLAVMPVAAYVWAGAYPWPTDDLLVGYLSPLLFVVPELALVVLLAMLVKGIRPFLLSVGVAGCASAYLLAFAAPICRGPGLHQF